MKRSFAVARIVLFAALACAVATAQTPIKRGLPAVTVALTKSEIYSVDEFNANVSRIEKAWVARMNPTLSAADKEKARIELVASLKPKLLDAQISAMLFRQFCEREGIVVAESDLNAYIVRLKSQLGATGADDASLEQALAVSQGILLDLRTFARQRLLLLRYVQTKKAEEIKAIKGPTPAEILDAYEQMKPNLKVPETARLSIVFVDYRGKSAEERKKAMETMRSLAAKIRDDRSQFDKLLLGSFDPAAGYQAKSSITIANVKDAPGSYDPKFVDAVFKLKTGEISDLLENEEGLQIVRLNEQTPAKQLELYDAIPGQANLSVQDLLVQQLLGIAQETFAAQVQSDILTQLRGEASVTIMKDNLKGIIGDSELDGIAARYAKKKK
jgi:hypothetical protein